MSPSTATSLWTRRHRTVCGYRQQSIIEIPELVSSREPLAAQLDHFVDMVSGVVDADVERRRILPAHRVIGRLFEENAR